jgi:NAD(P)-dependent dehydrogenase (short-subunit alcohol dehydrogenase family)
MPQLSWLVTGCSSGLGETFVRSILARGDKVIASTRGDVSRLSALAEAGARTFSLDVTASQSEINAVVGKILEEGPIDVLVNNAGYIEAGISEEARYEDITLYTGRGIIHLRDHSYDSYVTQFETNFFGVIKTTQAVLPHFREKRSGTVVFIGSSGGVDGEPGAGPVS